jgi:hypothetical protein
MQFLRLLLLNQDVSRLETKSCAKIMLAKVTNLGQNIVLLASKHITRRPGHKIEDVRVETRKYQFLYAEADMYHQMFLSVFIPKQKKMYVLAKVIWVGAVHFTVLTAVGAGAGVLTGRVTVLV